MAVQSMLTCEGVKKLGAFKIPCCEYCHDHSRFSKKDHYLHQTHLGPLSQNAPGMGWCCCIVDHHIHTPKWKMKNSGSTIKNTVWTGNVVTTSNTIAEYAQKTVDIAEKLADEIAGYKNHLAEAVMKNTPLLEHVKPVPGPTLLCDDPQCAECSINDEKYWSTKLQGWLKHADYEAYNDSFHLDLEHPYIPGHGVCAPGAKSHPAKDWKIVPEWSAYMCLNGVGMPTFGVKYCANPIHCAVLHTTNDSYGLFLTISTGYKVSDYVPVEYMQYVMHVNYMSPPDEGPPF